MSLKVKITDILYAVVFMWGLVTIGSHSAFAHNGTLYWMFRIFEMIVVVLALLCSAAQIAKRGTTIRNSVIVIGVVFATYMSYRNSGRDDLFIASLLIIALAGTEFRKTVSYYFKGELIGFIVVLICCSLGVIKNTSFTAIRESGSVVRYYMGFAHANAFAGLAMQMTALFVYLNFKRIKNIHLILLVVFNYWVYTLAYSRTGLKLSLSLIFCVFVNKYASVLHFERIWKWITENTAKILLVAGIAGSVLLAVNYETVRSFSIFQSYDSLLTRVRLISAAMNVYEVSLFGQSINFVNSSVYSQAASDAAVIDNAFIYSLLQFGVVNTVLIIWGYIRSIRFARKEKDTAFILCAIVFIISGFTEKYFVDLTYNFTLLMFSCIIFMDKKAYLEGEQSE